MGGAISRFAANFTNGSTRFSGTTSQPRRQPVIEKYLEKLLTTITSLLVDSAVDAGSIIEGAVRTCGVCWSCFGPKL